MKKLTSLTTPSKIHHIYTDGSADYSTHGDIHAGFGVFFGDDDNRNISMPFIIYPITHNRAEIYGMVKAIEIMTMPYKLPMEKEKLIIYSDSQYAVKSITEWLPNWIKRGWKKSDGKDVENHDLFYWLNKLIKMYTNYYDIDFVWVPAHKSEPKTKDNPEYYQWYGNMMADKLAVAGREKSKIIDK